MEATTVRSLGFACALVAVVELVVFIRGVPTPLAALFTTLPPVVVVSLLYLPGPLLGLVTFNAWANLFGADRRALRWVPFAAAAATFAPVVPPLLSTLAGLIGALLAR